jgi:uncharacterized membrane-anchored protein YhcB (DUF1043 family)
VIGVITSLQEQVEWTLRVASLIVGLIVGIISLVGMMKKMRGKRSSSGERSNHH